MRRLPCSWRVSTQRNHWRTQMNTPKPGRRKAATKKLEPIDWHEFANDAGLHGNMSTLYRRPAAEDPTAYASPEALVEISKRRPPAPLAEPTVGPEPTDGMAPTAGLETPAAEIT